MDREKEINKILDFIYSDKCDLSTPKDKAIRLDAGGLNEHIKREDLKHLRIEKDFVSVEQTPGGQKIQRLLDWSNMSEIDRALLWQEAQMKYLASAKGNITVVVLGEKGHGNLHLTEIPIILRNDLITTLNHIDKKEFEVAIAHDRSSNKIESHERINAVLSGKKGIDHLIGKERHYLNSEKAIEFAVNKDFGERIERVQKDYKRTSLVLLDKAIHANLLEAKRKLQGNRGNFIWNAIPHYVEKWKLSIASNSAIKDHAKSVENYKKLVVELGKDQTLKRVTLNANDYLRAYNMRLDLEKEDLKQKIVKVVEKGKYEHSHKDTLSKLKEFDIGDSEHSQGRRR